MDVLIKGKPGLWQVATTVRNMAHCAKQEEDGKLTHASARFRDVILDEEQLENEVETPTRKDMIRQYLAQINGEEEELLRSQRRRLALFA